MTDCTTNPCNLCKERAKYAGIFVAVDKHGGSRGKARPNFVCGHCIPIHRPRIDVSRDCTQVWEVGSDGWTGPISCMDCGDEISVEITNPEGT